MKILGKYTYTVNDPVKGPRVYGPGDDIPWTVVYPVFLVFVFLFGCSGFYMAYGSSSVPKIFLFLHSGIAILVFTMGYLTVFGSDEVKWMFINGILGLSAVYTQIGRLLVYFGKDIHTFPIYLHVIPFLYFTMLMFLIRNALLDLTVSRDHPIRRRIVENAYLIGSTAVYLLL